MSQHAATHALNDPFEISKRQITISGAKLLERVTPPGRKKKNKDKENINPSLSVPTGRRCEQHINEMKSWVETAAQTQSLGLAAMLATF